MPRSRQEQLELSLSLQAQLDPRSLAAVSAKLDQLAKDPREILDSRQLEKLAGLASKVQRSFVDIGQPVSAALDGFADRFNELVHMYQVAQDDFAVAMQSADEDAVRAAQERIKLIEAGIEGLSKETTAKVNLVPNTHNLVKTGKMIADSFTDTLDSLKAGDLKGLAKALFSSAARATTHAAEKKAAQAAIQGALQGKGAAEGMAAVATKLGTAAVALSGVGMVVTALIGLLVAADQQDKEFNRTLLDGAGIADWSFASMSDGVVDLTKNLRMGQDAALDLAVAFRGDAKEYASILSALQQSGFTFRELTLGAESTEDAQEQLRSTMQNVAVSAKALGISFQEAASQYADFHETYGLSQQQTYEQFLAIATAAQNSSMGTKRFFTSVSQATSGMALYNVRMEEAAELLALTSKILGGADASDFIKSLTKGFSEESFADSAVRVLKAGQGDVSRISMASAKRSAEAFAKNFASNLPLLEKAIADSHVQIDASTFTDPDTLIKAMKDLSDRDRGAIIFQLQQLNTDESRGMAENLYQLKKLVDGSGGLSKQVRAMSSLDMQAKLAMLMQNIIGDNKRIADLSVQQLIALEQTTGMGREQIEKMGRVQDYLYGMYLNDKQGTNSFEEFVSNADLSNLHLEDQTEVLKTSEEYMSEVSSNTESIFGIMERYFQQFLRELMFISDGISALVKKLTGNTMALSRSETQVLTQRADKQIQDLQASIEALTLSLKEASALGDTAQVEGLAREISSQQAQIDELKREKAHVAQGVNPHHETVVQQDQQSARMELARDMEQVLAKYGDAWSYENIMKTMGPNPSQYSSYFSDDANYPELVPYRDLARQAGVLPMAQDFIMRPGSPAQRFSSADTVLGFKDNGPIDKVLGNGDSGGNTYNFNLYGGDTATIYNTIRTATKVSRGR